MKKIACNKEMLVILKDYQDNLLEVHRKMATDIAILLDYDDKVPADPVTAPLIAPTYYLVDNLTTYLDSVITSLEDRIEPTDDYEPLSYNKE